mmetsp:Transcript_82790/g.253065  ORF Transcript_82790/g.253065 Transcript_82790/m.253065 type:complete len:267 (+) Transcript_82790:2994-3794(+)
MQHNDVIAPAYSQYLPPMSITSKRRICKSDEASCFNMRKYATNSCKLIDHLATSLSTRASIGRRLNNTSPRAVLKQVALKKRRRSAKENIIRRAKKNNFAFMEASTSSPQLVHMRLYFCFRWSAKKSWTMGKKMLYRSGSKTLDIKPVAAKSLVRHGLVGRNCSTATMHTKSSNTKKESRVLGGTMMTMNINAISKNIPHVHKTQANGEVATSSDTGCRMPAFNARACSAASVPMSRCGQVVETTEKPERRSPTRSSKSCSAVRLP